MPRPKDLYTVGVVNDNRSNILYSGSSLQYASHDANTARIAAVLSGGSLLILTRKNGTVINSVTVSYGHATEGN